MFDEIVLNSILEEGPEVLAFLVIDTIGGFCFYMNHDMADDRIPAEYHQSIDLDIAKAIAEQVRVVKSLTRFGVERPLDDQERPTREYWSWFTWWKNYIQGLSEEQFHLLDLALANKEDVSAWRPEGSWKV